MKFYAPQVSFIDLLLRCPGMYMRPGTSQFDTVLTLMFGISLCAEGHDLADPVVERWQDFTNWLDEQYPEQVNANYEPTWDRFRAQFASDADAMDGLRAAYEKYLFTLS